MVMLYRILREGLQRKSFCEERTKDWSGKPDPDKQKLEEVILVFV